MGFHTNCLTHRKTTPASLSAQSRLQRERGKGKGGTVPSMPGCRGCLLPSHASGLCRSPATSSETQMLRATPTHFWKLVPEQEQGWQGEKCQLHCHT